MNILLITLACLPFAAFILASVLVDSGLLDMANGDFETTSDLPNELNC